MASQFTRRGILGLGAVAGMSIVVGRPAFASPPPRTLKLRNIHTGESFGATYWADGAYLPDALRDIRKVLRDHRSGEEHDMHPRLLDLLAELRSRLDTGEPYDVISGYRSPKTNGLMRKAKHGVAKRSLHMTGEAVDIRVPGRDLAHVQKTALALRRGGVGYYPASDFVHVDVGQIRHWGPRREA